MKRDEEQRLRDIEASLEREDPRLAARLTPDWSPVSTRTLARCATTMTMAGFGMVLMGMLFGWLFMAPGVLMAVVGFSLRLTLPTSTQVMNFGENADERGDDDEGARI